MNKSNKLLKLTMAASFAAVSIVIDVFFKQVLGIENFGLPFHAIPTVIGSIVLGPFYGVLIALVSDVLGVTISGKSFLPLFMVGAFFWGLLPGLFLHKRYSVFKLALVLPLTYLLASSANTFALDFYGFASGDFTWLLLRKAFIPLNSIIMIVIIKDVYYKMTPFYQDFGLTPQARPISIKTK